MFDFLSSPAIQAAFHKKPRPVVGLPAGAAQGQPVAPPRAGMGGLLGAGLGAMGGGLGVPLSSLPSYYPLAPPRNPIPAFGSQVGAAQNSTGIYGQSMYGARMPRVSSGAFRNMMPRWW